MRCGLLGERLGHSRSPEIHRTLGDYSYRLFEKRPDEVEGFLLHGDYDVINVTIPYKKTAFALCKEVSSVAAEIGNVNVVVKRLDGTLWGDNTDAWGFRKLVESVGAEVRGRKCVVLGTGGAATTAGAVLKAMGASEVVHVSRSGPDDYSNLDRHADASVLVNATPVGMYPNVDATPVSLDAFPRCEAVIDLVYNPSPTKLVAEAKRRGVPAACGELMLLEQARRASVYMRGNYYLYGPPGCGKSTFAKELSVEKGMPCVDLDAEIERRDGRTIASIFAAEGEGAFRRLEKAALAEVAAKGGAVVALGGGALLDPEARRLAEATGQVVFLECPEETLLERVQRSEARPLLRGDAVRRMKDLLAARREHYASFAVRIRPETRAG